MTTFQYRIFSGDSKPETSTKLNEMAADGWELVASHPTSEGFFILFMGFLSTQTTFIFRKPILP